MCVRACVHGECTMYARARVSVSGGTRRLRRCLWEFMLALIHGSQLGPASLLVLCSRLTAGNNERATQRRDNKAATIMTVRRGASLRHYSYRHLRREFPIVMPAKSPCYIRGTLNSHGIQTSLFFK